MYIYEDIIGRSDPMKKARSSFRIVTRELRVLNFIAGTRMTVRGIEKVPEDQAVLYVSNHRSYFDIVSLYPLCNNPTGFVAKKEMEKLPFFHRWMVNMNCQFLDRDDPKSGLKMIRDSVDVVRQGNSIYIFPEGTRTPGDEMLEFKEGSFKIAQRSGCLIIPVAISNTDNIFENHFPTIRPQKIVVTFGDPIDMKSLSKEDRLHIGTYVRSVIAGMLEENRTYMVDND